MPHVDDEVFGHLLRRLVEARPPRHVRRHGAGSDALGQFEHESAVDAGIVGERAPSLRSAAFGGTPDRVAAESVGPELVLRRKPPAE